VWQRGKLVAETFYKATNLSAYVNVWRRVMLSTSWPHYFHRFVEPITRTWLYSDRSVTEIICNLIIILFIIVNKLSYIYHHSDKIIVIYTCQYILMYNKNTWKLIILYIFLYNNYTESKRLCKVNNYTVYPNIGWLLLNYRKTLKTIIP